jgi:diguanylate cyclase (GGDEF)-like protein
MARVRRDLALLLPGGFVVLAALVLLRPGVTPEAVRPYIDVCAVVVLVLGVLLGWHHGRSRIIFALVLLGVADATLWWLARHEAVGGDPGRTIISALAVLLPVNLAAYSALPERDPATARGFARLLPILAQVAVVGLMVRAGVPALRAWMDQRWLDGDWTQWTTVPQVGVAAFAGAVLFVAVRYILQRDPIAIGLLWALCSSFLALHGISRGWDPTGFFVTGGWVLIGSLLEATCRWATHDRVTELPERHVLNRLLHRLGSPHFLALVRVDHFARIRKVFGREVADQVLRMVAAQLQRTPGEMVFRYGKDEFAVLFEGTSAAQAIPHLEHVRRMIASYGFVVRGPGRRRTEPSVAARPAGPRVVLNITVSIGAAERESHKIRPRHVIRAAHQALRHAIEGGRNQVIA